MTDYWDYYDEDFAWDDADAPIKPDLNFSRKRFAQIGMTDGEIEEYLASGYFVFPNDLVVDRFYGGALHSSNGRTRIPLESFLERRDGAKGRAISVSVSSVDELIHFVDSLRTQSPRGLLFRGQKQPYPLLRSGPNPFLAVDGIGEVSLLPSIWRRMREKTDNCFADFRSLGLLEWSSIVQSSFDNDEIRRRHDAAHKRGELLLTYGDMEDSEDPLLRDFARVSLDLTAGLDFNLANMFSTLLQHYGLRSPLLDLTTDLDIAVFFATHSFHEGPLCKYDFVGTNSRNAVIYAFEQDVSEMHEHVHERAVQLLRPLRPERQFCRVCRSAPWALNLPADFLVAVVRLDFDLLSPDRLTTAQLFPPREEDRFLAALKKHVLHPSHVTEFA